MFNARLSLQRNFVFGICAWLLLTPGMPTLDAADDLAEAFRAPPASAKPMTWMHWMNGNISQEGMTKDLQALADAGLGGVLIFSVERGIPQGKIDFNSPAYQAIVAHSIKEADRLGLTIGFHNCDGWSSSGGPWVTVEDSMKRVVASEVIVNGGAVSTILPQPPTLLKYYRDIAVVAYPATAADLAMVSKPPKITTSPETKNAALLLANHLDESLTLRNAGKDKVKAWIQLAYEQPFQAQALTIEHFSSGLSGTLLTSNDGKEFSKVTTCSSIRVGKKNHVMTKSFAPVTARFFRVEFDGSANLQHVELASDPRTATWPAAVGLSGMSDAQLPNPLTLDQTAFIPGKNIVVIRDQISKDGRLTTTLPAGIWRMVRLGFTTTGATNVQANPSGQGLECDKLSRAALERHFAEYIGKICADNKKFTSKTFLFTEIDSYEVGGQNWTDDFLDQFKAKKHYDLTPFLPLLVGRCIDNNETTTAILRDFRDVVCSLMIDNYYRHFTELCHQNGLKSYIEPYGLGPINDLTAGGAADIPMGEFWLNDVAVIVKSAISAGHTYGKNVISAESFTSRNNPNWKVHPYLLKNAGDKTWTEGINEFMFHRYAHQANTHVVPGMTMANVGTHLDGTQTWWRNAGKAYMEYLQRGSFLLRQGVPVSDALVYVGEASPHDAVSLDLPHGYQSDACDSEVLLNRLSVRDGRLVLPEGTSYRFLALRNSSKLSLKILHRLKELAEAGATIIGSRPSAPLGYLEQQNMRDEFQTLVTSLWGEPSAESHQVGSGEIIKPSSWKDILLRLAVTPDVIARIDDKPISASFIHRSAGQADIYFVLNPEDKAKIIDFSFRIRDRIPELWHADTGLTESLAEFRQEDGRTQFTLPMLGGDSAFIIFREPTDKRSFVQRVEQSNAVVNPDHYRIVNGPAQEFILQTAKNGGYSLTFSNKDVKKIEVRDLQADIALADNWQVAFDVKWGGPGDVVFPKLVDWKNHADNGIKYYSGTAIYRRKVTIPGSWLGPNKRFQLNLGQVEIAAVVKVNDKNIGTLWKPPFVIDVTDALVAGDNSFVIEVTNTWGNRLIGDELIPRNDGYSLNSPMVDWYTRNEPPPPTKRLTFTTYNFYEDDKKLSPSGLIGPVSLQQETYLPIRP